MLHTDPSSLCSTYVLDTAGSSSPVIMTIKTETKKSWFLFIYLIKTLQRFPGRYKATETDLEKKNQVNFCITLRNECTTK